ncbi:putative ABC transport system permease protein [Anaerocolumna xylanovorans DSM 12503]|uniref:Putative hemin transport system permease protein HrtB n=2 Tax=Anaerocolumna TaxID=1843210 RepID=A0A1M7Y2K9_9FIRM|nr:putative ABC transport system permease protein [Anaerocolumna xylanovorans DSM 12503]
MGRKKKGNIHYGHIIYRNLKRRISRTFLLSAFLFFMVFMIFSFTSILNSMREGLDSTVKRTGADILLVPKDYFSSVKDALFLGIPSTVYFDSSLEEKVAKEEGVEKVSSQMFLATIYNSPCCDEAVQIIAYHPESDFLIQPWIEKQLKREIPDGEIVAGSKLSYKKGDTAMFFGKKFPVAGKLKETGMGYDNTVFLNFNTAEELLKEPVVKNYLAIGNKKEVVSLITVKVDKKADIQKVVRALQDKYEKDNVSIETSGKLMEDTRHALKQYTTYFTFVEIILVAFTFESLLSFFIITMSERKKEYGIIKSLGGSTFKILSITIGEAAAIGIIGSLAGSFLSILILTLFRNFILLHLKLPYLRQSFSDLMLLTVFCTGLSVLTGVFAAILSSAAIQRKETYTLIRENE